MKRLLLACLALPAAAHAHATLQSAVPPAGAVLHAPLAQIVLQFSEPVEARFSRVTVLSQTGAAAVASGWNTDPHDPRRLLVPVIRLDPGTYTVSWRVISVDTHSARGSYQFSVAP